MQEEFLFLLKYCSHTMQSLVLSKLPHPLLQLLNYHKSNNYTHRSTIHPPLLDLLDWLSISMMVKQVIFCLWHYKEENNLLHSSSIGDQPPPSQIPSLDTSQENSLAVLNSVLAGSLLTSGTNDRMLVLNHALAVLKEICFNVISYNSHYR